MGTDPAGSCSQNGQTISCVNVPVDTIIGDAIIKAQIGNGAITDTDFRAEIRLADSGALSRTGGPNIIAIIFSTIALGIAGFFGFKYYQSRQIKI